MPIKLSSPVSSAPRSRPSRECRNQALANLGRPVSGSTNASPALPSATGASTNSSATMGSSNRYPNSLIPPASSSSSFKHKKKLQLKHEAQLRLENQSSTGQLDSHSPGSPPSPHYPHQSGASAAASHPGGGGAGYLGSSSASISSHGGGSVPSIQAQSQPSHQPGSSQPPSAGRIVIRLLRSEIEKSKSKGKKKHKHKSRRTAESGVAGGGEDLQLQGGSNQWSSSRSPSGVPSYTVSRVDCMLCDLTMRGR